MIITWSRCMKRKSKVSHFSHSKFTVQYFQVVLTQLGSNQPIMCACTCLEEGLNLILLKLIYRLRRPRHTEVEEDEVEEAKKCRGRGGKETPRPRRPRYAEVKEVGVRSGRRGQGG